MSLRRDVGGRDASCDIVVLGPYRGIGWHIDGVRELHMPVSDGGDEENSTTPSVGVVVRGRSALRSTSPIFAQALTQPPSLAIPTKPDIQPHAPSRRRAQDENLQRLPTQHP